MNKNFKILQNIIFLLDEVKGNMNKKNSKIIKQNRNDQEF